MGAREQCPWDETTCGTREVFCRMIDSKTSSTTFVNYKYFLLRNDITSSPSPFWFSPCSRWVTRRGTRRPPRTSPARTSRDRRLGPRVRRFARRLFLLSPGRADERAAAHERLLLRRFRFLLFLRLAKVFFPASARSLSHRASVTTRHLPSMVCTALVFTASVRNTSSSSASTSRHTSSLLTRARRSEPRSSHAQSTHWPLGSENTDSICARYIASSSAPGRQYTSRPSRTSPRSRRTLRVRTSETVVVRAAVHVRPARLAEEPDVGSDIARIDGARVTARRRFQRRPTPSPRAAPVAIRSFSAFEETSVSAFEGTSSSSVSSSSSSVPRVGFFRAVVFFSTRRHAVFFYHSSKPLRGALLLRARSRARSSWRF